MDRRNVEYATRRKLGSQSGANQLSMRAHNEKLILTLLRQHGSLSKMEISQISRLSSQAVSVITRELEASDLILKEDPIRGNVGQPTTPLRLNPNGAYFYGLKIGRRITELVLIDFVGKIIFQDQISYEYPVLQDVKEFSMIAIERAEEKLSREERERISGIGIAIPNEIWDWAQVIDVNPEYINDWRYVDLVFEYSKLLDIPVFLENDASAACAAELIFGGRNRPDNFLYIYMGYFVGGGVVMNNRQISGPTGNAGAIGSMVVLDENSTPTQLLEVSSIINLEKDIKSREASEPKILEHDFRWVNLEGAIENWVDKSAKGLAQAIVNSIAVVDFEAVLIDGWIPSNVRANLVNKTRNEMKKIYSVGLREPEILEGTVGINARSLGAASLPLSAQFMLE